jgi:hypothetical protein
LSVSDKVRAVLYHFLGFTAAIVAGLCGVAALALAVGVYAYYAETFGGDTFWYAYRYKVSTNQVRINKKPIDCDYYYAPVGYKGCQYKPVVKAYDKEGWLVGGDGAPYTSMIPNGSQRSPITTGRHGSRLIVRTFRI